MTDSERVCTGIAISVFLHFLLLLAWQPSYEEASVSRILLKVEIESSLAQEGIRKGTGLQSSSAADREETEKLNRKRRAYLQYIEDVDNAIHARRLLAGEKKLIGVALCAFTIQPDGTFTDIQLVSSSGTRELDASALRAVHAASGVIRRPTLIGSNAIHLSLQIKYQYDLQ